jgi:hypothetical protein
MIVWKPAILCKHKNRWICSWTWSLGFTHGVDSSTHKTLELAKKKAKYLDLPWKIRKKVYVLR